MFLYYLMAYWGGGGRGVEFFYISDSLEDVVFSGNMPKILGVCYLSSWMMDSESSCRW